MPFWLLLYGRIGHIRLLIKALAPFNATDTGLLVVACRIQGSVLSAETCDPVVENRHHRGGLRRVLYSCGRGCPAAGAPTAHHERLGCLAPSAPEIQVWSAILAHLAAHFIALLCIQHEIQTANVQTWPKNADFVCYLSAPLAA